MTEKELDDAQAKLMTHPTLDRDGWLVELALKLIDEVKRQRREFEERSQFHRNAPGILSDD